MKKLLLLSCCSVALGVLPSSLSAETLPEAVSIALAAHPTIEAAEQAREIAKETKREQRAAYFPEINASASAGRIYGDNSTSRGLTVSRGAAYSGLGEGSASITQPLFKGFETVNRVKAADARMQSETYNIADARESLAYQAVQAYWGLFHSQRLLAKVQDYKEIIEDYLNRIEMMVEEGAADESETAQARNLLLSLETSIIDYEGQVEAALANYRQVMGGLPRSSLQEPIMIGHLVPENPEGAVSLAQAEHPLLMALDRSMQASEYDAKAERGVLFPTLDAELSAYKKDQKEEIGGEVEDGRALLKMNWLFNTGGAQFARMDRARAEKSELLARKQETMRQIEGDIRRAYAEMKTAKKQMAVIEERKDVTQELLTAYETQFEGGRVRLLQLMQSENQLFGVEIERLDADYRYKLAEYNVLASMGKLNHFLAQVPDMPPPVTTMPKNQRVSRAIPQEPSVPKVSQRPESLSRSDIEKSIFTDALK